MSGPYLPNLQPIIAAGIDPRTNLPIKITGTNTESMRLDINRTLSVLDEQEAINRYKWYNLPEGLNSELIERMLYYKGNVAIFLMESDMKFYCLPYALDGNIDCYGRYLGITPVPFGAAVDAEGKEKPWIQGLTRAPIYDFMLAEDVTYEDLFTKCVLIHDYNPGDKQMVVPRAQLNKVFVNLESDCLPYMKTALMNSTGVIGLRCESENDSAQVYEASRALENAALTGQKFVPLTAPVEMQELMGGNVNRSEEFLLAMQALDNMRLSALGIDNGGLFEKKEHKLQVEAQFAAGPTAMTLKDGLAQRQNACNLLNSIFGTFIWCDTTEEAAGIDRNLDGEQAEKETPMSNGAAPNDTNTEVNE